MKVNLARTFNVNIVEYSIDVCGKQIFFERKLDKNYMRKSY